MPDARQQVGRGGNRFQSIAFCPGIVGAEVSLVISIRITTRRPGLGVRLMVDIREEIFADRDGFKSDKRLKMHARYTFQALHNLF